MSETFGRYTVIKQLGRGAMGIVYLASDPMLNRQVAVKTVDLAVQEPEEREFLRERLFRDARAAAVLKHPNIVAIYDVFEDTGRAYVVMEYIEGDSLAAALKNNPQPDVSAMLKVLRQMADALDYTHAKGVIHRDIKPANVMIDSTGTTKIMDFGIARISDTRTCTPTGMVMGTVEYMAPEQVLGEPLDGRADQFSLAVVAYQMMTGSTLFGPNTVATLTYKLVNEAAPPPRARNASLPHGVDVVLAKALSKKPADRFSTCSDFVLALATAFSDAPTAPLPVPVAPPMPLRVESTLALPPGTAATPPPARGSRKPVLVAAIAVVLLGGALAAVIWRPWDREPDFSDVTLPAATPSGTATAPVQPAPAQTPAPTTPAPATAAQPAPGKAAPAKTAPIQSSPVPAQTAPASTPPAVAKSPVAAAPPVPAPAAEPQPAQNAPPGASVPQTAPPASQAQMATETAPPEFSNLPAEPKDNSGSSAYAKALQRGEQQVRAQDYVGALHSFGDAVTLRPDSPHAHYNRAYVFQHFQQYDAAIRDYSEALRLQPTLVAAHTQIGICLVQMHRDPEALVEFQRALELNADAPNALFGRGNLYYRRRDFRAALADYDHLLRVNPRYAAAYHNRANVRQALGDFMGAAADRRMELSLR